MRRVEEERIQVLNNMEELEQKIKELDNQMDESAREVKKRQREGRWHFETAAKMSNLTIHCLMLSLFLKRSEVKLQVISSC